MPTTGLAEFVADLAMQHGVFFFYLRTPNDVLAKMVTRLADDDVITGGTEDLIVALKRAHVIDAASMVSLLGNYLDVKQAIEGVLLIILTSGGSFFDKVKTLKSQK